MTPTIDIWVDFTTQDDTGLPWTLLSEAADPARIVAGAFVIGFAIAAFPRVRSRREVKVEVRSND